MHKKRGQSYYSEVLNPHAKRFINRCLLCGREGFSPCILAADFESTLERSAIKRVLQSTYEALPLDESGRCEVCAAASHNE
jgi:hypothetical protein